MLKGHEKHLRDLYARGILLLCGPLQKSGGKGLLIFEGNSQEEVESYVLKDPFIVHKWYASYRVYEWREVCNNCLMNE